MVAADLSKTNELEESFLRTPEEEKRIIRELTNSKEANWKEGDTYYVISNRLVSNKLRTPFIWDNTGWWRKWQKYVGADESDNGFDGYSDSSQHEKFPFSKDIFRPGLIDNSDIMLNGVDSEGDPMGLRPMLQEEHDYVLVPQIVWKKLFQWYDGGPAIPRKVISHGNLYKSLVVEVYPLCLHLVDSRDNSLSTIWISKMATVGELYSTICHRSNLRKEEVQIWDYFNKEKHQLLSDYDKTLEETQLQLDQYILLEMANDRPLSSGNRMDSTGNEMALVTVEPLRPFGLNAEGATLSNGISPKHTSVVRKNSLDSLLTVGGDEHEPLRSDSKGNGRGLTGLLNLGNTCFMNSALQCLVHTSPLVEYFLQDYRNEINSINPLGMSGQLAVAFGNLLRQLWSAGQTPIAPRVFKGKLSRFAPQFSGYNQHDSQELLAFLLDGLHEDLNRVKHKPYIEARDADGRPDVIVADECWANHKARNDSIIVDVCQGQYKSTLVCPVCAKVSVTFDPFMYLSLPLPSTATRVMTVTVLACDGSALPMPYTVNVQKHGYCRDLTRALSSACCLEKGECLLLAEVYEHQICRYIENSESLSVIKDDEHIVAYRLSTKHEKLPRIEIMHRNKDRTTSDRPNIGHQEFFGTPLVSCLNEDNLTGNDLQATIRVLLMPLLRKKSAYIGCPDKESVPSSIRSDSYPTSEDMDMVSSSNSAFQIWLLRDQGFSRSAIENDAQINLSACIKVVLDWFEREHKLYDTSYLEDLPEVFKSGLLAKKTRSEAISLFSCLEAFLKEEPLGPDDMWYCPRCKEHRQATKKLDLWKLPEILVVHLKRFSYNRFLKNKIDTFVSFPVQRLDLSKYVNHTPNIPQSHVYELYAVSNHYGGLGGGHYSAFVKLIEENRWYHFDDSHVSPINEDGIKTAAAYVLFYRRIKEDPSSSHSL